MRFWIVVFLFLGLLYGSQPANAVSLGSVGVKVLHVASKVIRGAEYVADGAVVASVVVDKGTHVVHAALEKVADYLEYR